MLEKTGERLLEYAPNLLFALILAVLGFVVIKLAIVMLKKALGRSRLDPIAASFLISLLRAVLYVILGVMILSQLKVPMSSIVAALGTAGLAIGLAMKDSLSNVAGGFILMFNRPFKAGDFVEINGSEGMVDQITILYTKLLTTDNKAVLIPNGTVASATITNYTQEELRRLEMKFSVSYDSDVKTALSLLIKCAEDSPLSLDAPEQPFARICAYEDSCVKLMLRVWVRSENYWELFYQLNAIVRDAFDSSGISIPFPQADIHITGSN